MKLWLENKKDKEYEMEENEILDKFLKSDFYQREEERYYFGIGNRLVHFIGSPNGLNSIIGHDDFIKLNDILYKRLNTCQHPLDNRYQKSGQGYCSKCGAIMT